MSISGSKNKNVMKSKTCLECGNKIAGRADKKYCSSECRSAFNNRLNGESTNLIRRVNNILRKNRRILKNLNPNGKRKIDRQKLMEEGFNFNYFTNIYQTKDKRKYYFCYDQGYIELEKTNLALVERKEYVK